MYIEFDKEQGDKKGISSVRINKKYRLEFTVREYSLNITCKLPGMTAGCLPSWKTYVSR